MKCIINNAGEVKRVKDQEAGTMVTKGWEYCPKTKWKAGNVGSAVKTEKPGAAASEAEASTSGVAEDSGVSKKSKGDQEKKPKKDRQPRQHRQPRNVRSA